MVDYEKGQTALHKAAWYQRRTICCVLVEARACLTRKDNQGNTPRMQALRADDRELAAYLEKRSLSLKEKIFKTSITKKEKHSTMWFC
ncbi:diacylglycerol kinase zeta-like isoform X1 [Ruditapes philippinarum]|uniref:diacylglycerol kinase zeta-like isoform X1 n=1 Tax=Ruditapes philippinarum TaxID=129788 RepID=UPI00295B3AD6|nr:diacylglycerol kinase zeta-like isoform X1 [Ruditapes philippinarum]